MTKLCSLFSGLGGIEAGFLKVFDDLDIVFASELNEKTRNAYKLHFEHDIKGDITKIDEKNIPEHDILVGGFPCQAFSITGKRQGFNDTRGTLFFDVARIIKEKQPNIVVLENVKGLLSHDNGKSVEVILNTLFELDYLVDFEVLNSKYFDVPQSRERVVFVCIKNGYNNIQKEDWKPSTNKMVQKIKKGFKGVNSFNFEFPEQKNVNKKLKDILEDNVDEKYTNKLIKYDEYLTEKIKDKLTKEKNGETVSYIMATRDNLKAFDAERRIYSKENITGTILKSLSSIPKLLVSTHDGFYVRKLTPLECMRLQGFSDELYKKLRDDGFSDTKIYEMCGNAVTTTVFEAVAEKIKNTIINR